MQLHCLSKKTTSSNLFPVLADLVFFFLFLLVSTSPFYPGALQIPPTDAQCHKSVSVTHVRGKKTPKWPQTTGSGKLQHANDRWLRPGCPTSSQSWAQQCFTWLMPSACLLAIRRAMVFLCWLYSLLWWGLFWNWMTKTVISWLLIKINNGFQGRFIKLQLPIQTPVSKLLY